MTDRSHVNRRRTSVSPGITTCDDAGVTALGVLGPLVLHGPDGPVRLGSARQRRLLAALAADLDRAVGVGLLVELVWGDDVPADPAGALQTIVARLRRLLPPGLRLVTTPQGYRLAADRAAVDTTAFADHLAAAASADPQVCLDRLAAALALWRGRPFCELDHPSLEPEVARLEALRTDAAEQHAEALLAVGRVGEAVAAAEALVAAAPLRESAVGVVMRALVAAGRQGDALAAYARLRARLADELGLDPGPRLRALAQQVLRQEVPAAPVRPAAARPPPLPVSTFVGRDADLEQVVAHLARCRVVTLCGPGGVGKTRLATHAAAAVAGRYADGVTVVAFGDGGAADVAPLLAAALRLADGTTVDGAPAPRLVDRIVEVLAVSRRLLVLDNCEHVPDAVAPLVEAVAAAAPGSTSCSPAASRCGSTASTSCPWRRCRPRRPRGCWSTASAPVIRPMPRTPTTRSSARCAGGSTACRWPSSSPPPGSGRSGCAGCPTPSPTSRAAARSRCCAPVGGRPRPGTGRCTTSSPGPTGCSTTGSGPCSSGWRCSPARWSGPPSSRCAAPRTRCPTSSSAPSSSGSRGSPPASACWRRCGPSVAPGSRRTGAPRTCAPGTRRGRPASPTRSPPVAGGPARRRPSGGSTPTWPTCAAPTAGCATTGRSTSCCG